MDNPAPAFTGSEEIPADDLLTDLEKRLDWLCSDWQDALEIDSHDEWHDVRMAIYGAVQTLIMGSTRREELEILRELGNVAFERGLDCIADGKYEGAPK